MTPNLAADVAAAFRRETTALSETLAGLNEHEWALPTPAERWTVTDQVAHLTFVFDLAMTACLAPTEFTARTAAVAQVGFQAAVEHGLAEYGGGGPHAVYERFRVAAALAARALELTSAETVPWLVNPLSPATLGMAGMLETFAHGQDVRDTVDAAVTRTDDLAYLVHFIAHTRDFGYLSHDRQPPEEEFRFEANLPSGRVLTVGPAEASQVVRGSAEDLALLASRRRHNGDLGIEVTGDDAQAWLEIAQAYRGPAGTGRRPRQFARSA